MAGRWRVIGRDRDNCCVGHTKDGDRCGRPGKRSADGRYWCHVHKVQELSAFILQESRE